MRLKDALKIFPGFRYVVESMEVISAPGKNLLFEQKMLRSDEEIERTFDLLSEFSDWMNRKASEEDMDMIEHIFMKLHDINRTLDNLEKKLILDDIELFEIKSLALMTQSVSGIFKTTGLKAISLPDTRYVVDILDPEHTGNSSFYIYDHYSTKLSGLRKDLLKEESGSEEAAEIYAMIKEEENAVKKELSEKLQKYVAELKEALLCLSLADIIIAKVKLARKENLTRPKVRQEGDFTILEGMFNPAVKAVLQQDDLQFQNVDIKITEGITLISGANMGGKSVLLKSIALCQIMFQFGFHVPAEKAELVPVSNIFLITGDSQSEYSGLSSFAAEMLNINQAIDSVRKSHKSLVLIDEPARTTNPEEGRIIVNSLIEFFSRYSSFTVITTHYSGLVAPRRLRVKGLSEKEISTLKNIREISRLMDYSLVEYNNCEIPHEALRVAEIIGFDREVLEIANSRIGDKYKK